MQDLTATYGFHYIVIPLDFVCSLLLRMYKQREPSLVKIE